MKILKIIVAILVGLFLLGGILYLVNKSSNDSANADLFKSIPENADFIGVINLEAFMTLFFTNIGDIWELSDEFQEDPEAKKMQEEIQLSGINLSRKIVLFSIDNYLNALVPVKDESDFTGYLNEMVSKSTVTSLGNREYFHRELDSYITYNESLCLISQKQLNDPNLIKSKELWSQVLNKSQLNKELSNDFLALQNSEEHFSLLVKEDEMAKRSSEFDHSPQTFTEITFEDGQIKLQSTSSSANKTLKNPLSSAGNSLPKSDYLNIHVNIDPNSNWKYWLSESTIKELENELSYADLDSIPLNKWNGSFNLSLNGISASTEEVITYDYDDNFELVEKKSLVESNQLDFTAHLGFNEPVNELDLSKFSSQKILTETDGNTVWLGTSEELKKNETSAEYPIYITAHPGNILDLAIEMGIPMAMMGKRFVPLVEDIEFKMFPDNDELKGELLIKMPRKDKNSLIYLIGEAKKLNF